VKQLGLFPDAAPVIARGDWLLLERQPAIEQLEVVGVLDRDPRWDRRPGRRACEVIESDLLC